MEASLHDLSLPWLVAPNYSHPTLKLGDVFQIITEEMKNNPPDGPISIQELVPLVIKSEKHGPFYHVFSMGDLSRSWLCIVLACHQQGKATLREDFCNFHALGAKGIPFFPKCYALRELHVKGSCETLLMGILEWLDGYYEVHASKEGGILRFELWRPNGYRYLSYHETIRFYEGALKILFSCYNPSTQERLSPWTHITGDFVFNPDPMNPYPVKLTTARGLKVWSDLPSEPELRFIYAGLLWLLETLLINRVDRERGIGKLLFLPPYVLKATLEAFLDECIRFNQPFFTALSLLKDMNFEDLITLYRIVLDELELGHDVENFLKGKIADHIQDLLTMIQL